jgi:hypothetical protein
MLTSIAQPARFAPGALHTVAPTSVGTGAPSARMNRAEGWRFAAYAGHDRGRTVQIAWMHANIRSTINRADAKSRTTGFRQPSAATSCACPEDWQPVSAQMRDRSRCGRIKRLIQTPYDHHIDGTLRGARPCRRRQGQGKGGSPCRHDEKRGCDKLVSRDKLDAVRQTIIAEIRDSRASTLQWVATMLVGQAAVIVTLQQLI